MSDYDRDIALAQERAGVRTQSGHHMRSGGSSAGRLTPHHYREFLGACYDCNFPREAHWWFDEMPDRPDDEQNPWVDRVDHFDR